MRLALFALLISSSCWGSNCPGWDATPQAGFERMESYRLGVCVRDEPCHTLARCFCASKWSCLDAGYRESCGQLEVPGPCGEALTQAVDLDECPE